MKKQTRYFCQGFVFLMTITLFVEKAHARPSRPFYQAGRALMMGDAYTAVGTGYEAVYYNPAGLARRNRPKIKLIDIETTLNSGFASLFSGDIMSFTDMPHMLNKVQSNSGVPYSLGFAVLPQFLVRNFSFGVLYRVQSEAVHNATSNTTDMYSFADFGGYLHYSVAFGGGVVKLGIGAKLLNRAELERTYTAADFSAGNFEFNNQWQEGVALGWDAGMLITLPVQSFPTLGITIHDIGHTKFSDKRLMFTGDSAPAGAPPALDQKINVGYSMIFKHQRGSRSVVAFDVKDVTQSGKYWDRFHAGWELSLGQTYQFRLGLNQGRYWTAGVGLDFGSVGLEFGSYGENLAELGEERLSDRKYVARYVISF